MIGRLAIRLYLAAGHIARPLMEAMLRWRVRRGKEDPLRLQERFGIAGVMRPPGNLIWFHAASVGETNAVLPVIGRLRDRGFQILLTTGTVTSAEIAARRLPDGAIHQFIPLDLVRYIVPFLDHWTPGLAVFAESEIWPATLDCLGTRGIPFILVNGRMSARSYRGWRRSGPVARAIMSGIELCIAQSSADARRFEKLGVKTVEIAGNLKFDVPAPAADEGKMSELRALIGARPVLVAASTHDGEEAFIVETHRALRKDFRDLLTILVPRHPARGEALAAEIGASGLVLAQRSAGQKIEHETDIYVADTVGDMGLWYRVGSIIFLGGSLVAHGGQNPIEPAKLGAPVLHGPHVSNFSDIFATLHEARAAVQVDDAPALTAAAAALLADGDERQRLAREARACVERQVGALDRTMTAISRYLEKAGGGGDSHV